MSIVVENVTKYYGKQAALNEVNFEVAKGDIVGFLGPNGAGKSTMMKIITGFIPPTYGAVKVNDLDVAENRLKVSKSIGYLPEHNPLYLDMYVKEYLQFIAGVYKLKNKNEKINQIIESTGLSLERKKRIRELSKGYKQRVGLAQALIHDPDVLILDEPTSGLDPNQIIEIRGLIKDVGKQKTVMLSTHIMQEVEALCDKVIIINKGQIIANETIKNIREKVKESQQTALVEFFGAINQNALRTTQGVSKVVETEKNTFLVRSESEEDIRHIVFDFAMKNNHRILTLHRNEKTLEEIFQELTSK